MSVGLKLITVIQMLIVPTQVDRSFVHVTMAILATELFVKVRNHFLFIFKCTALYFFIVLPKIPMKLFPY